MKWILFFFIFAVGAQAGDLEVIEVIEVIEVRETNRPRVYELVNESNLKTSVLLDCASFIHNLTIKNDKESFIYYLSVPECKKIYDYINRIYFSKRRCINYESDQLLLNDCELQRQGGK